MSTAQESKDLHVYEDMPQARLAANEFAASSVSITVSGDLYRQGGRRYLSLVLPLERVFDLVIPATPHKRGTPRPEPATTRNRPLDTHHVREIDLYLRRNDQYLMPPVIVNSSAPLDIFVDRSDRPVKPAVLVLPPKDALYVADGQHRIEALRQAAKLKPDLLKDAIGVTLIEEMDLQRIHQDFYDAAQTKKLEPALLVEYDGRSMGNALARAISSTVSLFKDRTERLSNSIGKNSLMLFSTNQVKQACFFLVLGDVKGKSSQVLERVNQKITPAYDTYVQWVQTFFERMIAGNPQWQEIVQQPLSRAQVQDPVPRLREQYLHCVAGGLNVMCAVGHAILSMEGATTTDTFTPTQERLLEALATLDWARTNPLWQGHIVSAGGTVTPHRDNLTLAIAKVKEHLGMELSKQEQHALERMIELTAPVV